MAHEKKTSTRRLKDKRLEIQQLERVLRKAGLHLPWKKRILNFLCASGKFLFYTALVSSIGYFLWNFSVSQYSGLQIKSLELRSNGIVPKEKIFPLLGLKGNENLLTLDVQGIEERVRSSPAIKRLVIRREFPSTLCVDIDARIPQLWIECPKLGIRDHNPQQGMFVDADGVIFSYDQQIHKDYYYSPILRIPYPGNLKIAPGHTIEQFKGVVQLLKLLIREKSIYIPPVDEITISNEWSYLVKFRSGCKATFSIYDFEQQIENLSLILEHAAQTHRTVIAVNLMMERNIPVQYSSQQEEIIPTAIPLDK